MLHKIAYRLSLLINFIFGLTVAYILGAFSWSKIEAQKKVTEPEVDTTNWTRS